MAKKRKPKKDDAEQSEKFVETAQKLDVDESGKSFRETLKRMFSKRDKPE